MAEIAGWIAPAATMIAAMMTAANLGARVTGWGFVVFTIGSIAWTIVGLTSGQTNLVLSNAFLTLVNLIGIWRWLGRQAGYERGGTNAATASARAAVPTLYPAGGMIGAAVTNPDGRGVGIVVDAMLRHDDHAVAYVVVSTGGIGGVGEKLHALRPDDLTFGADGVQTHLSASAIRAKTVVETDHWPESL